ncbi:hypothetical protein F5H01DRAFT_327844 [Linnemannia elongata]|nr:hypothetical protein F5H01DRAFT_327844 [Linnemannia elongata]
MEGGSGLLVASFLSPTCAATRSSSSLSPDSDLLSTPSRYSPSLACAPRWIDSSISWAYSSKGFLPWNPTAP